MDCWSLEVIFSHMLGPAGRLPTRLVPGGVQGAEVGEMILSGMGRLAPFWNLFWSTMVMLLRCFV